MELSSVNSLPHEIIIEILTRLPLKSVLRCRCVSNLLYTITQEHEFIKKHRRRDHSTLPLTIDEDGRLLATVREKSCRYLGDSQGLLLLKTRGNRQHHLWNPTRNEMLDLPTPSKRRRLYHNIAMCFLPTTNQCKLINNVYYDQKEENAFGVGCEVLTVGTDSAWRPLTISCLGDVRDEEELSDFRIMSKVFYMVRFFKDGGLGDRYVSQLICFEMGNEHVTIINIPRLFFSSDHKNHVMLLKWKKKPSIVSKVEDDLHIWLLEDYKEEKWAEKKIVISLTFLNEYPNMRTFRGIGAKGDELSIYNCRGETVRYNVESQQVIYSPPVPSREIAYCVRPSLARLKGMKSEEKPKDCDDLA